MRSTPRQDKQSLFTLHRQRVLVVGASGRSGAAAASLSHRLGATVLLSDRNPDSRFWPPSTALPGERLVDLRPREDPGLFDEHAVDLVITAPGVPLSGPLFERARALQLPIFGENDFGFAELRRVAPYTFLGITGTDGKSTTTALTAHLLSALGTPAIPCGNFGLPLSEIALEPPSAETVLVVECSSFQLEPLTFFHPDAAAILNVAPDHQDRYPDAASYLAAKLRIAALLEGDDELFVAPSLVANVLQRFPGLEGRTRTVDVGAPPAGEWGRMWRELGAELRLPGGHNQSNLGFALGLVYHVLEGRGVVPDRESLRYAVASFRGLPHRMELIGDGGAVRFVNDSKATTIQAVTRALESFGDGRGLHHLLGGRSKGADFGMLQGVAPKALRYPFGESAGAIAQTLGLNETYPNLESAVAAAVRNATELAGATSGSSGGGGQGTQLQTILLSPGCASYDQFRSFEERGERFRRIAQEILNEDAGSSAEEQRHD